MDLFSDILRKLKGEYVDIFLEEKITNQLQMEENKVQKCSSVFDKGLGVRVIKEGKTFYAYTNDLTKNGIEELISSLKSKDNGNHINLKKIEPSMQFFIKINPADVEISQKINFIKRANEVAWKESSKVKQVRVLYADSFQKIKIASSEGIFSEEKRIQTLFLIHVVTHENGVIQTGYEAVGGFKGI
ncbi:MAG: PmbA/TldA family metallopeptidase, partial [Thermodesulfovibrio sp.]